MKPLLIKDLGMMYPCATSKQRKRYGIYKCECGNEFKAQSYHIKTGHTSSCGCLLKNMLIKYNTEHNLSHHRMYNTWNGIVDRCTNSNSKAYKNYGALGIYVCNEWLNIENFINDMFHTFKEGLTLDRINTTKGYYKENCRWATKTTQARNRKQVSTSNKSGYKGVFKIKDKFVAQIKVNSKAIRLGLFDSAIDGANAYNKYVLDNKLEHTINNI